MLPYYYDLISPSFISTQGSLPQENAVTLLQAKTCPTTYNSETWSESDYASRPFGSRVLGFGFWVWSGQRV